MKFARKRSSESEKNKRSARNIVPRFSNKNINWINFPQLVKLSNQLSFCYALNKIYLFLDKWDFSRWNSFILKYWLLHFKLFNWTLIKIIRELISICNWILNFRIKICIENNLPASGKLDILLIKHPWIKHWNASCKSIAKAAYNSLVYLVKLIFS